MEHNRFFPPHAGVSLRELAKHLGADVADEKSSDRVVRSVAPVYRAVEGDVCYILSRKNMDELKTCNASAIICDASMQSIIPPHVPIILSSKPHAAFAIAGALLHPAAMRAVTVGTAESGISSSAFVDPTARLEAGVLVEPMAVVGANAEIGEGTQIGAGAIIGAGVKIGRNCSISAGASVLCAYIGNNVIIHNGARIGQDGFGYAPGPAGMLKIVQVGRVIIQDDVEIGANTTIDRGTMDDTVIGEGTKIDNQAQIGHNVRIGRHTAIVSQVGIAGSARIGDGVQIGGQAGVAGHIHVGDGAQLAAGSGVIFDLAPGGRYGGVPARPIKDFLREMAETMAKIGSRKKVRDGKDD
ncbi:UDP-3-O-(3-hydroxymyristoyl)glucosamine N-acyltransferase [Rhizobium tumorigenes]|uniref:UDP-3-O-(3-hydroxymyristoyl)glucosamine N-acyltransferase n=1 Tax=Rhizobium tumorigenes TaxID=2041385 RepID=UPI00241DC627|nr:UDP-3-O-(3-hydroxymyristoyl)glucosamine N-acyltransferase [Rhizobium tumorigenes]WFS02259.1 UDP-3-O-(3-hydroxymyristoyl)glucosamine N-acyltransferase [Rhizobium tumorigenes]